MGCEAQKPSPDHSNAKRIPFRHTTVISLPCLIYACHNQYLGKSNGMVEKLRAAYRHTEPPALESLGCSQVILVMEARTHAPT
jgi:hypothetical protein